MDNIIEEIEKQRSFYEKQSILKTQQKAAHLSLAQQAIAKTLTAYSNLPFWLWDLTDEREHAAAYDDTLGKCCFNHAIGLPRKQDKPLPLFDYEQELYEAILKHKRVWCKKATGLGVTEFTLRFMVWLALSEKQQQAHSTFCIVTGPRIDLALDLITRLKNLFIGKLQGIEFEDKNTVLTLGKVRIEAFPSHHLASMRGLPNVRFILVDEADFFPLGQQDECRTTIERYIGKSDAYIVLVSTPNAPGGLFQTIEEEPQSLYHKVVLGWQRGLNKIYTEHDIEQAKRSPSFEREYNLQYLGSIGNVFSTTDVDRICQTEYEIAEYLDENVGISTNSSSTGNKLVQSVMGCDPGWGTSSFGIVVSHYVDGLVRITYADLHSRKDHNEMVSIVWDLIQRFNVTKVLVDASAPSFIRALKLQWGERTEYETMDKRYREYMKVEPVPFGSEHRQLLYHTKFLVENQYVKISPRFEKLITALRSAYARDGVLDKDATTFDDLFDALRLCLRVYKEANE